MKLNLAAVRKDTTKMEEGVWDTYKGAIKLKIRSVESMIYRETIAEKLRALGESGFMSEKDRNANQNTAIRETAAEVLVADWEACDENDKPVPYDKETVRGVLLDPGYAGVLNFVQERANRDEPYLEKIQDPEEITGNS